MNTASFSLVQVAVPALVALAVVALTHTFSQRRDLQNRRREQRISYLISVYRALSKANHHPRLYEVADELEQALADVQLFGTPEQVALAQKFATELGTTESAPMDDFLMELRRSLRSELGAAPLNGRIVWLRVTRRFKDDEK